MSDASKPFLRIRDVVKKFGEFTALKDISLDVKESEFVCFLGPSGCGKTTLLRAIAGLDFQDSSVYGRVSKLRNLSFLTLAEIGNERVFVGVNEDGLLGIHFNRFSIC